MENYNSEKFIKNVLVHDVQKLIDNRFNYFAFVIIGQGIEVLGSFFDDKPFDYYERGLPKKRFKRGLKLMENIKYQELGNFLWDNFRCALVHQLKIKKEITLTSYQDGANDEVHLKKGDKSNLIYLVVDTLFENFKVACEKVIEEVGKEDSEIIMSKKEKIHIIVRKTELQINPDGTITEL